MSAFLNAAELIKARLLKPPGEGELATPLDLSSLHDCILVDRQKDIMSEVDKAVAKASGTAISILWNGWVTLNENASRPHLGSRYTVTVWSKSIIAGPNLPADAVMASVILRLWHWISADGGHAHGEAQPKNGGQVPDPDFLNYDCEVVIPISL